HGGAIRRVGHCRILRRTRNRRHPGADGSSGERKTGAEEYNPCVLHGIPLSGIGQVWYGRSAERQPCQTTPPNEAISIRPRSFLFPRNKPPRALRTRGGLLSQRSGKTRVRV